MPVIQKIHRLHRKCEQLAAAFLIEPAHEALLQPVDRSPLHGGAIRENEVLKHPLEIWAVEIGDVPEHALIPARRRRLIERIHHLLERVGDHLVNAAFAVGEVDGLIRVQIIVVAVLFADEVIHVAEPFRRGHCAAELGSQREHQIDECAGEGREILRRVAGAADGGVAAQQKGVQRHGRAVGFADNRRFIVAVNLVLLHLTQIFFRQINAVQFAELSIHRQPVQRDRVLLEQLRLQRGDVLLLHIRIGIDAGCGGGVLCLRIAINELLVACVVLVFVNSHGILSFHSASEWRLDSSFAVRRFPIWERA